MGQHTGHEKNAKISGLESQPHSFSPSSQLPKLEGEMIHILGTKIKS